MISNLFPFELNMNRNERILGRLYLPVHLFIFPLFINLYAGLVNPEADMVRLNLAYYIIGFFFVLATMRSYLRKDYDVLCDRFFKCVVTMCTAYFLDLALSALVSLFSAPLFEGLLDLATTTPNDATVAAMATGSYGYTRAISVFLAPLLEEVLFRGVVFGGLRSKNRVLAYAVSILLFGLYHVWQFVFAYGDPTMLMYIIMYVPVSFALTWSYERSGTIWTPIFFHMLLNSMSLQLLTTM